MRTSDIIFFAVMYGLVSLFITGFMLGHNRQQGSRVDIWDVLSVLFWPLAMIVAFGIKAGSEKFE